MRNLTRSLFVNLGVLFSIAFGLPGAGGAQPLEPPAALPPPIELNAPPPPQPQANEGEGEAEAPAASTTPTDDDEDILPPPWLNEASAPAVQASAKKRASVSSTKTLSTPIAASSQHGATGLLRVLSAQAIGQGRLSLQFTGQVSSGRSVIVRGDRNLNLGGTLALAYGLLPQLELFGSFSGASNRNRRVCTGSVCESEPGRVDPEIIRAFGDLVVGAKLAHQVDAATRLALYSSVRFMSSTDNVFVDLGATSLALGGAGSWDLSQSQQWPIRLHANLGYFIDNSGNLQNYDGVNQPSQLVSSYAYGIGRSRFQTALAFEVVPQRLTRSFLLSPFIEYHLQLVTGRADRAFADFAQPLCVESGRPCQDNRDQQSLSAGARAQLPGLWTATAAIDLGLRSVGFPFGPPQAPLTFVFQVGRPFDTGPSASTGVSHAARPEPQVAAGPSAEVGEDAQDGVIVGRVLTKADGKPLGLAIVSVEGRAHAKVASDPDGSFTTHDLESGVYDVTVTAPGFEPQTVRARVGEGMATEMEILMSPRIKTMVRGQVLDAAGKGVAAEVTFEGSRSAVAQADADGRYEADLPPGVYIVRAQAEAKLTKDQRLSLNAGQTIDVNFTLRPQREVAAVEWRGGSGGLVVRLPVNFQSQAGGLPVVINPASLQVLDEIVDLLVKQPRVQRLVIETHWDAAVGRVDALTVTQQQAQAISDYLQAQGVAADRLELAPRGASSPVIPGVGKGAAQNRRVVFTVIAG